MSIRVLAVSYKNKHFPEKTVFLHPTTQEMKLLYFITKGKSGQLAVIRKSGCLSIFVDDQLERVGRLLNETGPHRSEVLISKDDSVSHKRDGWIDRCNEGSSP